MNRKFYIQNLLPFLIIIVLLVFPRYVFADALSGLEILFQILIGLIILTLIGIGIVIYYSIRRKLWARIMGLIISGIQFVLGLILSGSSDASELDVPGNILLAFGFLTGLLLLVIKPKEKKTSENLF